LSQINAGVQSADSSIVNSDTKNTLQTNPDWLKRKLGREDGPNGTASRADSRDLIYRSEVLRQTVDHFMYRRDSTMNLDEPAA
jgi:hypothetical protein